jgi:uncharacterized protein YyaL (SSP411 family)
MNKICDLLAATVCPNQENAGENEYYMKMAGNWLLEAQTVGLGIGYAHSYSLFSGWKQPYPETTGYIIPTMIQLGSYLNDERYITSALQAGEWLLKIQKADGSFIDLRGQKQIFDTGQILEGLIGLFKKTENSEYLVAARKSGDFLIKNQDTDGKWTKFAYHGIPHTYYSRVAANLLKLHEITGESAYKRAAEKQLRWTIAQQKDNGYFNYMSFLTAQLPYLHTIIYVLEGLLEANTFLHNEDILSCLKKTVDVLVAINKNRDDILFAQYDSNWTYLKKEKCMTGLAQWARLLLHLYILMKEEDYFIQARKTILFVKSKQVQSGTKNIKGAVPGSIPIWGSYFRFSFNNWTVKFYIDALLLLAQVEKQHSREE